MLCNAVSFSGRFFIRARHQSCKRQIFVNVRPIKTSTAATDFAVIALLRRCGVKQRRPERWNAENVPVCQKNLHRFISKFDCLRQRALRDVSAGFIPHPIRQNNAAPRFEHTKYAPYSVLDLPIQEQCKEFGRPRLLNRKSFAVHCRPFYRCQAQGQIRVEGALWCQRREVIPRTICPPPSDHSAYLSDKANLFPLTPGLKHPNGIRASRLHQIAAFSSSSSTSCGQFAENPNLARFSSMNCVSDL